jgi:hypothetical protein
MSQNRTELFFVLTKIVTKRLGLILFILYIIQVIIGNLIHRFKPRSSLRRRPAQNYFHAFLGIVIIGTSFYQVHTGYKDEYPVATGQDPLPKTADIIFYVWLAVSHPPGICDIQDMGRSDSISLPSHSLFLSYILLASRSSPSSLARRPHPGTNKLLPTRCVPLSGAHEFLIDGACHLNSLFHVLHPGRYAPDFPLYSSTCYPHLFQPHVRGCHFTLRLSLSLSDCFHHLRARVRSPGSLTL